MDMDRQKKMKYLGIALALILALVSFFGVSPWASKPENYANVMETIDDLQNQALGLTATAAALATGAAAVPGDATTPLANKLMDVAGYMVIVYVAITVERYLLTLMGVVAFKFLVPVGVIAFAVSCAFLNGRWKQMMNRMAIKFAVMGILLWLLVPVSVWTTNIINHTYASAHSLDTLTQTDITNTENEENQSEQTEDDSEKAGFWNSISDIFSDLTENVKKEAGAKIEELQNALNKMIEGVAVMIVTTCVIPVGVLLLFLWIIQTVTGLKISTDTVEKHLPKKKDNER